MRQLLIVASFASLCACSARAPRDLDESTGSKHRTPIVNGKETTDYPAAGMLFQNGQAMCSGTVIAPNKVLTAAHCVEDGSYGLGFALGPSDQQVDTYVDALGAVQHPSWNSQALENDIAVVTLAQDLPVTPVALNPKMDQSWIGKVVILVGYGVSDGPSQTGFGIKRMTDVTIDKLEPTTLWYTTQQGKSACNGDSGGPAFFEDGGQLFVVGVTSWGDDSCQQFGVYTRVDAFLDWVNQEIAKDPGPADPQDPNDPNYPDPNDPNYPSDPNDPGGGCGGETWEGRCEGNLVIWCEAGEVMAIECPTGCGFDPQAGYYDCM